jgi:hypothetical protein
MTRSQEQSRPLVTSEAFGWTLSQILAVMESNELKWLPSRDSNPDRRLKGQRSARATKLVYPNSPGNSCPLDKMNSPLFRTFRGRP